MSRWRLSRRRLSLFVFAMFLFLLACEELALRALGFSFQPLTHLTTLPSVGELQMEADYDRHPTRFWVPRSGFRASHSVGGPHGATISRLHTRGPEPVIPKPAGTFRILCLGDSRTFGQGVDDEESWPARLSALLNAPFSNPRAPTSDLQPQVSNLKPHPSRLYDVVNAGVCGYTTFQAVRTYEELEGVLAPDLVILATGCNDARPMPLPDSMQRVQPQWKLELWGVLGLTRIGQLALWLQQRDLRGAARTDGEGWVARVGGREFVSLVSTLAKDCAAKGRPLFYLRMFSHQREAAELESAGLVRLISFEPYEQIGQIWMVLNGSHPGPESYAVLAEIVAEEIRARIPE